jgi:RNA polymerase sigma factor (sigma-70 family)
VGRPRVYMHRPSPTVGPDMATAAPIQLTAAVTGSDDVGSSLAELSAPRGAARSQLVAAVNIPGQPASPRVPGFVPGVGPVRDPDAVLGYLRTAVVNGARSVHRSRGRARLLRVRHDPPVWSAEAAVIDGEDRRAVLAAIAALPQRQREVLALKYYLDLSERDIAAIMRVSRGTVAAASSRALAARAPPSGGPMNSQLPGDLEDRVRDAYQAAGRTVQLQTLRQTTLRVTDGSARRPRRLNALIPVAAAAAVFAVIGASVALPRLLTGSASPAGKPGISASVLAHDPPFQVIVTHAATGTGLLVRTPAGQVDSARPTTGHHVGRRHRHREPVSFQRGKQLIDEADKLTN